MTAKTVKYSTVTPDDFSIVSFSYCLWEQFVDFINYINFLYSFNYY